MSPSEHPVQPSDTLLGWRDPLGAPPAPFLSAACGSQGRQEQTGVSDQDNCLILDDAADPDDAYDKLIRPWKSRLGIIYAENSNVLLDIRLIWLTILAILDKPKALNGVQAILRRLNADPEVIAVARRDRALEPARAPE